MRLIWVFAFFVLIGPRVSLSADEVPNVADFSWDKLNEVELVYAGELLQYFGQREYELKDETGVTIKESKQFVRSNSPYFEVYFYKAEKSKNSLIISNPFKLNFLKNGEEKKKFYIGLKSKVTGEVVGARSLELLGRRVDFEPGRSLERDRRVFSLLNSFNESKRVNSGFDKDRNDKDLVNTWKFGAPTVVFAFFDAFVAWRFFLNGGMKKWKFKADCSSFIGKVGVFLFGSLNQGTITTNTAWAVGGLWLWYQHIEHNVFEPQLDRYRELLGLNQRWFDEMDNSNEEFSKYKMDLAINEMEALSYFRGRKLTANEVRRAKQRNQDLSLKDFFIPYPDYTVD